MSAVSPDVVPVADARTLRQVIVVAEERLSETGVASPRHDAEEIAAHLLRVSRGDLWRYIDDEPPVGFADLVRRRSMRVPLQHITGQAHFRTVSLAVGPGVFIPRPETEVVVEFALTMLHESSNRTPLVVDLCAGSGAIALAIATEFPGARVHAVENDPGALPWLRRNVKHADVLVSEDDIDGCLEQLPSQFDLVIANPPYIPTDAVPRELEVARHDPGLALYSGADGLGHIRTVERTAARLLRPDGIVVVEHADEQGQSAPQIFRDTRDWEDVRDHRDLTGRDRYLSARRSSTKENR